MAPEALAEKVVMDMHTELGEINTNKLEFAENGFWWFRLHRKIGNFTDGCQLFESFKNGLPIDLGLLQTMTAEHSDTIVKVDIVGSLPEHWIKSTYLWCRTTSQNSMEAGRFNGGDGQTPE